MYFSPHRQIQGEALYATSTFVYDHAGKLWINQPTGSSPGDSTLPYSEGYLSRWGSYTDYELRQAPAISLMPYMGGTYYDPATGRYVNRSADGVNPYAAFISGNLDDFIDGFWMTALDLASMSPGPIGKGADAISAYISYKQGDYVGTALSASSVVTNGAGSGIKIGRRFGKMLANTKAVETAIAKASSFRIPAPSPSMQRGFVAYRQLKLFPPEKFDRVKHYGYTPTAAQKASVPAGMEFDHDPMLVKHYYEGHNGSLPGYQMTDIERREFAADLNHGAAATPTMQRRQGARAAAYSKRMKKFWFIKIGKG